MVVFVFAFVALCGWLVACLFVWWCGMCMHTHTFFTSSSTKSFFGGRVGLGKLRHVEIENINSTTLKFGAVRREDTQATDMKQMWGIAFLGRHTVRRGVRNICLVVCWTGLSPSAANADNQHALVFEQQLRVRKLQS